MRRLSLLAFFTLFGCEDGGDHNMRDDARAAIETDGGGAGDGGSSNDSATGPGRNVSFEEAYVPVLAKLRACGLVTGDGKYNGFLDVLYPNKCVGRCALGIECGLLKQDWCMGGGETAGGIGSCYARCRGESVYCASTLRNATRCNGTVECPDDSDEADCDFFFCKDGKRINDALQCDGRPQCAGEEDEEGCPNTSFKCADGNPPLPFGFALECNGTPECADGSDERECVERGRGFACDGAVIPIYLVCDGRPDCVDGSDEMQGCAMSTCPPIEE